MTQNKTAFTLALALHGRVAQLSATQALEAVLAAAAEMGIDFDSPALTAADLAAVLDAAADGPTQAWCGKTIYGPQSVVDRHLESCAECQAEIARLGKADPPGYSGGIAELGYEGDG
jgi:hypothetical protein